jgi:hypothetical protein
MVIASITQQKRELEYKLDLLEPLKVIPKLHVEGIGDDLWEPTVFVVLALQETRKSTTAQITYKGGPRKLHNLRRPKLAVVD